MLIRKQLTPHQLFVVGLGLSLLVIVGVGFNLIGSPFKQRDILLDVRRHQDFYNIQNQMRTDYYSAPVPVSMSEFRAKMKTRKVNILDPETGQEYFYERLGEKSYQLCTDFSTDTLNQEDQYSSYNYLEFNLFSSYNYVHSYSHEAGYDCVEFTTGSYYPTSTPTPTLTPTPVRISDSQLKVQLKKLDGAVEEYQIGDEISFTSIGTVYRVVVTGFYNYAQSRDPEGWETVFVGVDVENTGSKAAYYRDGSGDFVLSSPVKEVYVNSTVYSTPASYRTLQPIMLQPGFKTIGVKFYLVPEDQTEFLLTLNESGALGRDDTGT